MMEIRSPEKPFAGNVYECSSKKSLVDYHHALCWSPTKSGWVKVISNNFFASWPGLTPHVVNKYLQKSEATVMGHLRQT